MSRINYSQAHTKTHSATQAEEVSIRTLNSDATSIKEGSEIPKPKTFTPPPATEKITQKKEGHKGLVKTIIWLAVLMVMGVLGYLYLYPLVKNALLPEVA